MFLRSSKTIVVIPNKRTIVCHDYLSKVSIQCEVETLYWLSRFNIWSSPEKIADEHPDYDRKDLIQKFLELQEIGLLQKKGSKTAAREKHFSRDWKFGLSSAILHFTCTNSTYISLEESAVRQVEKLSEAPPPQLFKRSSQLKNSFGFDSMPRIANLLRLMATRRTNRSAQSISLNQGQLLDCLFAGLGITSFTQTVAGTVPLKMTPSGGARNPFEAYVLVKDVTGMTPGFYHFSSSECVLTRVLNPPAELSSTVLLGGQSWAEDMPAIVFLVAMLERTMWKYQDDNAYRVVLIEAGHIGQNIVLAATAHGLTGCPTAALAHHEISKQLNLDDILHNPIYAITLSYPKASPDVTHLNNDLPIVLQRCLQDREQNPLDSKRRLPQRSLQNVNDI